MDGPLWSPWDSRWTTESLTAWISDLLRFWAVVMTVFGHKLSPGSSPFFPSEWSELRFFTCMFKADERVLFNNNNKFLSAVNLTHTNESVESECVSETKKWWRLNGLRSWGSEWGFECNTKLIHFTSSNAKLPCRFFFVFCFLFCTFESNFPHSLVVIISLNYI